METNQMGKYSYRNILVRIIIASAFIVAGLVYVGYNLGIVDSYWFNIIISWQMILIVAAIIHFIKIHIWSGLVLLAVGVFFLLPEMTNIDGDYLGIYWPLIFVFVGLGILFKRKNQHPDRKWNRMDRSSCPSDTYTSKNGFVVSDNTFGSVQQIVLDPVFKGARLKNTFGETVLDLRRTKLEAAETVIEIDCSFGGIEIYMPGHWNLQSQVNAVIGGCDDKRYNPGTEVDVEHVLIVRGSISFGGVEFKS